MTDLAIIGAGAAGLAAAIFAGEAARGRDLRIVLLDGARKPGAKILVSGGGRCNVTNEKVTPEDFWGGSRTIIRNVLRAFDNKRTIEWMADLGVQLKLEATGKYFPVSDSARTILDALLNRTRALGVELLASHRVSGIVPMEGGFRIDLLEHESINARRVIIATGGLSLPKSGSDGAGLRMLQSLGHKIVPTTPALSPLVLGPIEGAGGRFADLSGLTLDARLAVHEPNGRRIEEQTGSLLFTHFGISGPAALNISRHLLRARLENPNAPATLTFGHPSLSNSEAADQWLRRQGEENPKKHAANAIGVLFPERLARLLAEDAGPIAQLPRGRRLMLARDLAALPLNVTGDRGYSFAETTAGGIDLRDIHHGSMESRRVPGMHICGEMLDVDGRIGGFNFQWSWASGHVAARSAVAGL